AAVVTSIVVLHVAPGRRSPLGLAVGIGKFAPPSPTERRGRRCRPLLLAQTRFGNPLRESKSVVGTAQTCRRLLTSPGPVAGGVAEVRAILVCQEARVLRQNAMFGGEFNQLLLEFLVAPLQVELVDDFPHSPGRPQSGHERIAIVVALVGELRGKIVRLLVV